MLTEEIALFTSIFNRNSKKNNVMRNTISLNVINVENIDYINNSTITPSDGEIVRVSCDVEEPTQYLKFIYNIITENDEGKVRIHCLGNNGFLQIFEVGNFSGTSIPFYVKTNFNITRIIIEMVSSHPFVVNQLELIDITRYEYKFNKLKQYSSKGRNLLRVQPHLKKKFIKEWKQNGARATLGKVKMKLYNSEPNTNVIQYSKEFVTNFVKDKNSNKLLFLSHDAQNAGASILALNMVRSLKREYRKEIIVLLLKGGPLEKEFAEFADVINLNQNSLSHLENEAEVNRVIETIRNQGVNYCIANSIVSNILLKTIKRHGIETVSLIHELPTSIKTYGFTEAALSATVNAKKVVFPNDFVKEQFQKNFKLENGKIVVQAQGIFNKRSEPLNREKAKKHLCNTLKIHEESLIILGGGYGDLRKGLDLFFSIANELVKNQNNRGIHFVWMGDCDPILKQWVLHDGIVLGNESNIHFIEFQKNPAPIYQGADLFILSSREDPFPSIVLEAIDNGVPVLAFEGSGGVAQLVNNLGVNSIPYADIVSMANEAKRILNDNELYYNLVNKGLEVIERDYNFSDYVRKIMELVDSNYSLASSLKVSVIIPNYNYEMFIEERLDSIISQTVKPYEIIFLDDASNDNSVALAKKVLENSGIKFSVIANENNVGCFGQWINGISEASGDVIWIAEADDLCEPTLLEELLPFFKDQEVNLAYCQSQIIDENSMKIDYKYTQYTNDLSEEKWLSSYVLSGKEEVVQGLSIKNTIPNASAVLMRLSALDGIEGYLRDFKISGDWFSYLYAIRNGKIAFCSETLNYHRRHSNSIISKNEQSVNLYKEIIEIKEFIINHYELPSSIWDSFVEHVAKDYSRLGCKGYTSRNILDNTIIRDRYVSLKQKIIESMGNINYLHTDKRLLFVAPDFEVGGGQMLVIRLANFFASFHKVYIYSARPWLLDIKMIKMISPSVVVLESSGDPEELEKYIIDNNINTVNSHIWWSDKITYKALKNTSTNWVLSMHGCYEALLNNSEWENEFIDLAPSMLERANHIIYAADKNLEIFNKIQVEYQSKIKKVYYGYDKQGTLPKQVESLGIKENEFIFGLVSRAIKEKGWEESIKAIILLNSKGSVKSHLILVGEGEYASTIKEKYKEYDYIHFIMNLTEPSEWIGWVKVFDVALLPTYFISESLPNSIIEYLAYGKPVITTNIGEIKHMIYSNDKNKYAGILLELNSNKTVEVNDIVTAMNLMITDKEMYLEFKKNTDLLFEQFTMKHFASKYFDVFN